MATSSASNLKLSRRARTPAQRPEVRATRDVNYCYGAKLVSETACTSRLRDTVMFMTEAARHPPHLSLFSVTLCAFVLSYLLGLGGKWHVLQSRGLPPRIWYGTADERNLYGRVNRDHPWCTASDHAWFHLLEIWMQLARLASNPHAQSLGADAPPRPKTPPHSSSRHTSQLQKLCFFRPHTYTHLLARSSVIMADKKETEEIGK